MRHWRMIAMAAFVTLGVTALAFLLRVAPRFGQVQVQYRAGDRVLLDRHGHMLDETHGLSSGASHRLQWIALKQISPDVIRALLLAEDPYFYNHFGLLPEKLKASRASTLTERVVDGLENLARERNEPSPFSLTLRREWRAMALEAAWSKAEILEAFLNLAIFQEHWQGVAAASYGLFAKPPSELNDVESALLVALLQTNGDDLYVLQTRACVLLRQMGELPACARVNLDHLRLLTQSWKLQPHLSVAPQVAEQLVRARGAELTEHPILQTTLDRDHQWAAQQALMEQLASAANGSDGAVVGIENSTGHVVVYVGHGHGRKLDDGDAAQQLHPGAAALAPLFVAKALDERIVTPATPLSAAHDLTLRQALALQSAAAFSQIQYWLGGAVLQKAAQDFGLTTFAHEDSGHSLSLIEVANAYRALARGGMWTPVKFANDELSEVASRRVLSTGAVYILTDLLMQMPTAGPGWARHCVDDGFDHWCLGFSDAQTVAVWLGVPARVSAQRVWDAVMTDLQAGQAAGTFDPPPDVVRAETAEHNGETDWFLAGTEPSASQVGPSSRSRITFPHDQSKVSLGDLAGRTKSRLFIQIALPQANQNLYINGERMGRAQSLQEWEAHAGEYFLELRDALGHTLDHVHFTVEGRDLAAG